MKKFLSTVYICDKNIVDDTLDQEGEDAIYCEGMCRGWLHHMQVCWSIMNHGSGS